MTAARVPGRPEILFVPAGLAAGVRKSADDFRSKDVFGVTAADLTGVEVDRGRGRLALGTDAAAARMVCWKSSVEMSATRWRRRIGPSMALALTIDRLRALTICTSF